jgi:phosphatidylserine decarboxylase
MMTDEMQEAGAGDRAFAWVQELLPKRFLSNTMHRLARSTRPAVSRTMIGSLLRAYPMIDMREAQQPDPYAYTSFNEFFTRALAPGVRPVASGQADVACPVDGTLSQAGKIAQGSLLQAKGVSYTAAALLADLDAASRFAGGDFACLYLAPHNYHRIHMPLDGRLEATRYVPGQFFSVSAATARAVPGLYARNERVVCEFETAFGPLAMVLVGAMFVGSIETVYAGEINPPPVRGGGVRRIDAGIGSTFAKGDELGRFNMGSTVIMLLGGDSGQFTLDKKPGAVVRMGERLGRAA